MIAAGVVAARHRLDIAPVVFWGWIGAMLGGMVGWLIGLKAGRAVLTAPGPLYKLRLGAAKEGERAFQRVEVMAIIVSPPWVAGINRSRPKLYLPVNALSALLLWAAPLGIGAYYAGPPILDIFGDMGTFLSVLFGLTVAVIVVGALLRRRSSACAEVPLSGPPAARPYGTRAAITGAAWAVKTPGWSAGARGPGRGTALVDLLSASGSAGSWRRCSRARSSGQSRQRRCRAPRPPRPRWPARRPPSTAHARTGAGGRWIVCAWPGGRITFYSRESRRRTRPGTEPAACPRRAGSPRGGEAGCSRALGPGLAVEERRHRAPSRWPPESALRGWPHSSKKSPSV